MSLDDAIQQGFYSGDADAVDAAEVAEAPVIQTPDALARTAGWCRLPLPLPVVHPAAEGRVAGALDISRSQLDRILGEDLAIDADAVTWELEDAPPSATAGVAAVVRALDGRVALTDAVPIPPAPQRTTELLANLATLFDAIAAVSTHGPTPTAHQALYDAVWMLVWNVRKTDTSQ